VHMLIPGDNAKRAPPSKKNIILTGNGNVIKPLIASCVASINPL
jgi:hypothetical protein